MDKLPARPSPTFMSMTRAVEFLAGRQSLGDFHNSVICYTNVNSNAIAVLTLSEIQRTSGCGGQSIQCQSHSRRRRRTNQQVMAFDNTGAPLWSYGQPGGYQPTVRRWRRTILVHGRGKRRNFLTFAPDGSFWVGDGGNNRALHFSAARNYIEQYV